MISLHCQHQLAQTGTADLNPIGPVMLKIVVVLLPEIWELKTHHPLDILYVSENALISCFSKPVLVALYK